MFEKRCMDKSMEMDMNMNQHNDYSNMNMLHGNMSMDMGYAPMQLEGITCPVVYECPIEKVCHREICHHVPHVCPFM